MPNPQIQDLIAVRVDRSAAMVHEHGWQSWSPSTSYSVLDRPWRPTNEQNRLMSWRSDTHPPADAFQGEGLLAVEPGDGGPVVVVAAADGRELVPSVVARLVGDEVRISADGPVDITTDDGPGGMDGALARWADGTAARWDLPAVRPAPTTWCSWYQYFTEVTEADLDENLAAMAATDLPIDVVQIDDGYQAELGDWLTLSKRFESLGDAVARIRSAGRRAGLWLAPFLVGERSRTWAQHPDWLVTDLHGPVDPGRNWGQRLGALDTTHPDAEAHLLEVFRTFREIGIDFFKIDFIYAGAMTGHRRGNATGLAAYRHGLELIRDAIGPDAYLLGCGAPILPSAGLVDAMRISPDTAPHREPDGGDLSQPSGRAAELTGVGRAFLHGRFWVNDPDCLIARPAMEEREAWAAHVERYGGLRSSSDRIADLDGWGLDTTRRILGTPPPEHFIPS